MYLIVTSCFAVSYVSFLNTKQFAHGLQSSSLDVIRYSPCLNYAHERCCIDEIGQRSFWHCGKQASRTRLSSFRGPLSWISANSVSPPSTWASSSSSELTDRKHIHWSEFCSNCMISRVSTLISPFPKRKSAACSGLAWKEARHGITCAGQTLWMRMSWRRLLWSRYFVCVASECSIR